MRELRANLNFIAEPLKINHKERKERKELMANISVFFREFPWFSLFAFFEFSVVNNYELIQERTRFLYGSYLCIPLATIGSGCEKHIHHQFARRVNM